jgi:hypothetical protein
MNIYYIQRNDYNDAEHDSCRSAVIIAISSVQARKIMRNESDGENTKWNIKDSKVINLGIYKGKKIIPEIICLDYLHG